MSNHVNDMLYDLAREQFEWDVHKAQHTKPTDSPENHPDCYHCRVWIEDGVYDHAANESGMEVQDEN